jgi:hypothetical protein
MSSSASSSYLTPSPVSLSFLWKIYFQYLYTVQKRVRELRKVIQLFSFFGVIKKVKKDCDVKIIKGVLLVVLNRKNLYLIYCYSSAQISLSITGKCDLQKFTMDKKRLNKATGTIQNTNMVAQM